MKHKEKSKKMMAKDEEADSRFSKMRKGGKGKMRKGKKAKGSRGM